MKENQKNRADIAIIGTGPAGLSAAITAKIRKKEILLFGEKDLSSKVHKAAEIKNYLGIPDTSGAALGKAFENHIRQMGIEITEKKINMIYAMEDYFSIQTMENELYEAQTVILATGVSFGKALPGETEFLGRGVSYCATCDALFYKGKRVAVLGYHKEAEEEADFLSEIAEEVLYFPVYRGESKTAQGVRVISETPKEIRGNWKAESLVTNQQEYQVDGIFVLRESIPPAQLVPGLHTQEGHVIVNLQMETNLAGCFACGDIAGKPYQYIKSAGQGNVAALSAVAYLAEKKRTVEEAEENGKNQNGKRA